MSEAAAILPDGARALMAQRVDYDDLLQLFPTPPWATRALLEELFGADDPLPCQMTAWEPAAGLGHMVEPLRERFNEVWASDVHDYGYGYRVGSFIGSGPDVIGEPPGPVHWVITNPPFAHAVEFVQRGLEVATDGVAILIPTRWTEGLERHEILFSRTPPSLILQFAERVPMHKGRWDPAGGTATAYQWHVWYRGETAETVFRWIPPGRQKALTRPSDLKNLAGRSSGAFDATADSQSTLI